jgi:carboxypeptidase family protein
MNRAVLALLIFSASGCGITEPKVTLHLAGTVTAQATGQPIAGAQVMLLDESRPFQFGNPTLAETTTDAQGKYSLSYSVSGMGNCTGFALQFPLVATASGFTEAGSPGELLCSESVQVFDFALAPATTP